MLHRYVGSGRWYSSQSNAAITARLLGKALESYDARQIVGNDLGSNADYFVSLSPLQRLNVISPTTSHADYI